MAVVTRAAGPEDAAAITETVWTPPGAAELSDEEAARLEPLLRRLIGAHADDVLEGIDRYRRLGFVERGEFSLPAGGPTVTTMWRTAR